MARGGREIKPSCRLLTARTTCLPRNPPYLGPKTLAIKSPVPYSGFSPKMSDPLTRVQRSMPRIIVTQRSGETVEVDGKAGISIMENLVANGIDEIAAICGGCCSCATCHVHVDAAWLDKLAERDEDEVDLLSDSEHNRANSRLSCQIELSDALDGIAVTVAPED